MLILHPPPSYKKASGSKGGADHCKNELLWEEKYTVHNADAHCIGFLNETNVRGPHLYSREAADGDDDHRRIMLQVPICCPPGKGVEGMNAVMNALGTNVVYPTLLVRT